MSAKRALGIIQDRAEALGASGIARAVLAVLWRCTNQDGNCFPSQLYLARKSGFSERAVRAALKELERLGLIVREIIGRGPKRRTVYKIPLADVNPATPGTVIRGGCEALSANDLEDASGTTPAEPASAPPAPEAPPEPPEVHRHVAPAEDRHVVPENKEPEEERSPRAPARAVASGRRPGTTERMTRPGSAVDRSGGLRSNSGRGLGPMGSETGQHPPDEPPRDELLQRRTLALAAKIPPGPENPKGPAALAAVIARAELLQRQRRGGGGGAR